MLLIVFKVLLKWANINYIIIIIIISIQHNQ